MIHARRAFTLVELLVVIAIIGILVALLLPAVQAARESARRLSCQNHLSQLILAVNNYEMGQGAYPIGTTAEEGPVINWPRGNHHNWISRILPQLEQNNTYQAIDFSVGVYHPNNARVRKVTMRVLACPSDAQGGGPHSNYAGVHHDQEAPIDVTNHGVFILNEAIRYDDISDGAAHTLLLGEKLLESGGATDLGWMSGTRATLRNMGTPINGGVPGALPVFPLNNDQLPAFSAKEEALQFWMSDGQQEPGDGQEPPGDGQGSLGGAEEEADAAAVPGSAAETDDQGAAAEDQDGAAQASSFTLPPGRPQPALRIVGGFSSAHPGVCNFAFGDGRVEAISEGIDLQTYRQLGHRSDGKLLDEAKY